MVFALSETSDQPRHWPSLICLYCVQWIAQDLSFHYMVSGDVNKS